MKTERTPTSQHDYTGAIGSFGETLSRNSAVSEKREIGALGTFRA
jgi:hypothetical protein